MTSISSPLMKSISPIAHSVEGRIHAGRGKGLLYGQSRSGMTDVRSLHCPNCGAVADPHAPRCPYCRARLATVSCPQCFALMFAGSAFCPACGARSSRRDSEPTSRTCPSCREPLARVTLGELTLLECAACDGVWVDASDFDRVCADREARAAVLGRT